MSYQRTLRLALAVTVAASLVGLVAIPATAQPSTAQTAADQERVDRAVAELEAARAESARVDALAREVSAELDGILAEQHQARQRLTSRVRAMYRLGDTSFISVLLGAKSFEDFAARWDMLTRMNRQDAEDLLTLQTARAEAEQSANALMMLQAEQARAVDEVANKVAQTRDDLAASEAALAEYEARIAAQAQEAEPAEADPAPPQSDPTQQLVGSGDWQTAVASHYGLTFTGRGASGAEIGPYSMMVAHKTLPFGTLVEFEYNGKRAVASVEDRGPYTPGRTFDLGPGVIRVLGFSGVHEVRYRIIER